MSNGSTLIVFCSLAVVAAIAIHSASGAASSTPQARAALGGACNHSNNCTAPHSVCNNRICACESGYEVNGTICTIKLNSTCDQTHLCNRTGATCVNNICTCRPDHILSSNQQNCLAVANSLYSPCTEVQQCKNIGNSTCAYGGCICLANYFQTNPSKCELYPCIQQSCANFGFASCFQGYCRCNTGGILYGSYCYRHVGTIGAKCDVNNLDWCYLVADGMNQNVDCIKGKCTCKSPYKANKAKTSCSGAATTLVSMTFVLLAVMATLRA